MSFFFRLRSSEQSSLEASSTWQRGCQTDEWSSDQTAKGIHSRELENDHPRMEWNSVCLSTECNGGEQVKTTCVSECPNLGSPPWKQWDFVLLFATVDFAVSSGSVDLWGSSLRPADVVDDAIVDGNLSDDSAGVDVPDKEFSFRVTRGQITAIGAKWKATGIASHQMAGVTLLTVQFITRLLWDSIEQNLVIHGLKGSHAEDVFSESYSWHTVHMRLLMDSQLHWSPMFPIPQCLIIRRRNKATAAIKNAERVDSL